MKYKKWNLAAPEGSAVQALCRAGLPALAAVVLCARGLSTPEAAAGFLAAGEAPLHDPFLLKDMDKAAARLTLALERGETIAVYGDYDVDGITATCLLTQFLRSRGGEVVPYIPDRMEEGYGLNREAVDHLHQAGVRLIVTVDCGITAADETEYANSLGMEVIITDHHECKEILPAAVAVVDPRRSDCGYPFPCLAGVGVALKLALALTPPEEREQVLDDYADLAAVGTVADVMSLTGENRAIVRRGLKVLAHTRRPGFRALIREAGECRCLSATGIGYTLAPRINAAGRMGKAWVAADLLLAEDPQRAEALARELCELNRERQAIEGAIFQECLDRLERETARPRRALVLAGEGWHQGVVGIVASRLAERYACPTFMICLQDGRGKGSCRSFGGFNLFKALESCADLLEGFGGHALAAGFTIRAEHVDEFRARMTACVEAWSGGAELVSALNVDAELPDPALLTVEEVQGLGALEPYGAGNPKPVFSLSGCTIAAVSEVGGGRHLKLRLNRCGACLDAIFFSVTAQMANLSPGDRVDVAFTPQVNEFRGTRNVQLQVCDLRPAPTRVEAEQALFERLRQGEELTAREAAALIPSRAEFVAVWRYLSGHARLGRVEDTARRLARGVSRTYGIKETLMRTMVCLEVLDEHGLIRVERSTDHLRIDLCEVEGKVDLEDSVLMKRLRRLSQS
ncbi:MAG TPA: single-stranded-DNA-specific exonuclease RecJ [Candidatus Intestinimonas stercorigallinarum]|nr:single-stranded-DNA-specific exonuclease RecJ [Candidatus Intestinimonas stercorigallinarum]